MDDIRGTEPDERLTERALEEWRAGAYRRALGLLGRPDLADRVVESCWTNLMLRFVEGLPPRAPFAFLMQSVHLGSIQIRKGPHARVRLADDWEGEELALALPVHRAFADGGRETSLAAWRSALARAAAAILPALTPRQARAWCACRLARTMKRAATLAGMSPRDLRETVREIARKARKILR